MATTVGATSTPAVETALATKAMERTASTTPFTRIAEFQELAEYHRMLGCGQPNSSPEKEHQQPTGLVLPKIPGACDMICGLPRAIVLSESPLAGRTSL